eukprot:283237-Prymnesium_polylepis.2
MTSTLIGHGLAHSGNVRNIGARIGPSLSRCSHAATGGGSTVAGRRVLRQAAAATAKPATESFERGEPSTHAHTANFVTVLLENRPYQSLRQEPEEEEGGRRPSCAL